MVTLGELLPSIAEGLGDPEDLVISTFQELGHVADLVAYLPPDYNRYGIIDRDGRGYVEAGQTWICRPDRRGASIFLRPIKQVTLGGLLKAEDEILRELAQAIANQRPDLVDALKPNMGAAPQIIVDHSRVQELEGEVSDLQQKLQQIDQILNPSQAEPELDDLPVYLADANLFINAKRWKHADCAHIIAHAGSRYKIATTKAVLRELVHDYRLPAVMQVVPDVEVSAGLRRVAEVSGEVHGKKASDVDLGLVQALMDQPGFAGLITADTDILNLHPESLVKEKGGRDVEVVGPGDFIERHRKLFRGTGWFQ